MHAGLADGVGARQRGDRLVVGQGKVLLSVSHLVLVCSQPAESAFKLGIYLSVLCLDAQMWCRDMHGR
jgi:hypothetical protein